MTIIHRITTPFATFSLSRGVAARAASSTSRIRQRTCVPPRDLVAISFRLLNLPVARMHNRLRSAIVMASFVALSACGSDSLTDPGAATSLAGVLTELANPALLAANERVGDIGLPSATLSTSGCPYSAATNGFVCAPVTTDGATVRTSFYLLDGSRAPQSSFTPGRTAALRVDRLATGTQIEDGVTYTLADTASSTVSGLLSATHVLDGTDRLHIRYSGTDANGEFTIFTTTSGVVLPKTPGGYPAAGTITQVLNDPSQPSFSVTSRLTFNGTSKVTVLVTDSTGSTRCTFDIANPGSETCVPV